MKTSKGFAQIVYIVIIAALVTAAAGYLALKPKSTTAPEDNNKAEQNKPSTNSGSNDDDIEQPQEADPTADWKTYSNTDYGFVVRYPDEWKGVVEQSVAESPNQDYAVYVFGPTNLSGIDGFYIYVYERNFNQSIFPSAETKEQVVVDGRTAILEKHSNTHGQSSRVIFEEKGNTFVIMDGAENFTGIPEFEHFWKSLDFK